MADGDDREESDNQRDDANLPQVGHLQIGEPEESDNLEEEYMALDSQLNQIDACLDSLEARNDDLLSKLKAFLQTSQSPPDDDDKDNETGDDGSNSGEGAGAKEGSKDSEASSTSCSS